MCLAILRIILKFLRPCQLIRILQRNSLDLGSLINNLAQLVQFFSLKNCFTLILMCVSTFLLNTISNILVNLVLSFLINSTRNSSGPVVQMIVFFEYYFDFAVIFTCARWVMILRSQQIFKFFWDNHFPSKCDSFEIKTGFF